MAVHFNPIRFVPRPSPKADTTHHGPSTHVIYHPPVFIYLPWHHTMTVPATQSVEADGPSSGDIGAVLVTIVVMTICAFLIGAALMWAMGPK